MPSKESNENTTGTERIYIGGFDPPSLTVSDFLLRLEKTLGDHIEILSNTYPKNHDDDGDGATGNSTSRHVHLNVRVKTFSAIESYNKINSKSALEQIAKLYHNVTWKGCKLRVEAARPHFLERLQQEIRERQAATMKSDEEGESMNLLQEEEQQQLPSPPVRRRHLRIRERYGEQVFSVDSKPYEVKDWKGMTSLFRKINRRRQHFLEENQQQQSPSESVDIRTQSKLNRAVHLVFSEGEHETHFPTGKKDTRGQTAHDVDAVNSDSDESTRNDNNSTSDRSQSTKSQENEAKPSTSAYAWSSSEETESESSSEDDGSAKNQEYFSKETKNEVDISFLDESSGDDEENEEKACIHAKSNTAKQERSISSNDSSNHSREQDKADTKKFNKSTGEHAQPGLEQTFPNGSSSEESSSEEDKGASASAHEPGDSNKMPRPAHVWSDDDGSFSASEAEGPGNNHLPSDSDESESSMAIIKFNDDYEPVANRAANMTEDGSDNDDNLMKDVESNLNVLASLFPDMKQARPRTVSSAAKDSLEAAVASGSASNGWSREGVMLRYDPRSDFAKAASAKVTPATDVGLSVSSSRDQDSSSSFSSTPQTKSGQKINKQIDLSSNSNKSGKDEDTEDENAGQQIDLGESEVDVVVQTNVYKQDKLEDVFREAREGPTRVSTAADASDGFSFGFNLRTDEKQGAPAPAVQPGGFSFSFFSPTAHEEDNEQSFKKNAPVSSAIDEGSSDPVGIPPSSRVNPPNQQYIPAFRRRGLFFPKDRLERYQEDFYVMGDGLKILQDMDRYHKDEEVMEHWKQERHSLTLDWKRKRKYAVQPRKKHAKSGKHHHRR